MLYCTLGSGVHVQIMYDCCMGTYMAMWFAASIPSSPIYGISSHVIPLQSPHTPTVPPLVPHNRPQYMMLPSLCSCVLIVQHLTMSKNMLCLIFCSYVSLLRIMVSRFIRVPTNDTNSSFRIAA